MHLSIYPWFQTFILCVVKQGLLLKDNLVSAWACSLAPFVQQSATLLLSQASSSSSNHSEMKIEEPTKLFYSSCPCTFCWKALSKINEKTTSTVRTRILKTHSFHMRVLFLLILAFFSCLVKYLTLIPKFKQKLFLDEAKKPFSLFSLTKSIFT